MHCEDCVYSGLCHKKEKDLYVIGCDSGNPKELKTNADMIRGMTNIELAEFLTIYSKELGQYEYICDNNGFYFGYVSSSREEAIMRIMDTLEVSDLMNMKGKYARIATKGLGSSVKIIGNITKDKWFDYESFFKEDNQCKS